MNLFKKFFWGIVAILSLSMIIVLFLLQNNRSFLFFEDLFSRFSSIFQINSGEFSKQIEKKEEEVLVYTYGIKSYFFNFFYIFFDDCSNFFKFFDFFSLDEFRKRIDNNMKFLIDKLMHQSFDLLNSELIKNTTTILELGCGNSQSYWVIQLGALRNIQKVLEIVDVLKTYHYPVYISPNGTTEDSGDLVRIFIGPYFSRTKLEFILDDLYRLSTLRGDIYSYRRS